MATRILSTFLVIGLSVSLVAKPSPKCSGMLCASSWTLLGGLFGNPVSGLTNDGLGDLAIPVGTSAETSTNDLYRTSPSAVLTQGLSASLTVVATSGAPVFAFDPTSNPCTTAPAVGWYLTPTPPKHNDPNWAIYSRWYSTARVPLSVATFGVTATVDPAEWVSVYGIPATDAQAAPYWTYALSHVQQIGLAMGGGCFDGHGTFTTNGTATILLTSLSAS